ncbi:MAG: hypothetical protein ACKOEO_01150 [Planctomycetaceae bacterium]
MSVHVRSLLLAIAAVLLPAQSASACGGCLLLSPFRWLFGCDHYCGGALATPHNCNRFIDDWFGYGYLRNQQGTLGHYPGNWYRQGHAWHGRPLQPYPVITGGYGIPGPAIMPQLIPSAPIYNPCWDPCAGMAPQTPVVMQPPMPYPQPQWTAPVPVMAGPVWTGGDCCDPCGGGSTVMYGAPGPAQMIHDNSSGSDCGCSGGHSASYTLPPGVPPAGMLPQQPVSWQTGGWSNGGWSNGGWQTVSAPYAGNLAHGAPQLAPWTPNTVWQQHQFTHATAVAAASGHTWAAPQQTAWMHPQPYPQPQYAQRQHPQVQYAQPQYPQVQYAQPQYPQPQYAQLQYPQVQYAEPRYAQFQYPQTQYPQPQAQYPQPQLAQPSVAGAYQAAQAFVTPPAPVSMGSARLPIRRVSLASPPLGAAGARNYPNALR